MILPHFCAVLRPLLRCSEITDFHNIVLSNENARIWKLISTVSTFMHYVYLLWAFQVSVYNLMLVEVVHASGDLFGPLHQLLRRHLLPLPEGSEECPVGAVLHHNTEHGGLDTNSPGKIGLETFQSIMMLISTHLN